MNKQTITKCTNGRAHLVFMLETKITVEFFSFRYFDSNIFVMMVPIAGLSKAQFNLTYNYLLHRQNNKYKFPVYLFFRQGQYVSDVVVNTYLWEPSKIMDPTVNLFKEHNMPVASVEQSERQTFCY